MNMGRPNVSQVGRLALWDVVLVAYYCDLRCTAGKIEASRSRLTKDDLIASSSVPAALVLGSLSQVWPAKRREKAVSG
jgi:hypothetical protein